MSSVSTDQFTLADVSFAPWEAQSAARTLIESISTGAPRHYHLLNAYSIALAAKDDAYRGNFYEDAVNLADGKSIELSSRLLGQAQVEQIRGPELFRRTLESSQGRGLRHYFLGSTEATLHRLVRNIKTQYPGVVVAGHESPPFRPMSQLELKEQDQRIIDADPDVIWVGLGTPIQDSEAKRLVAATQRSAVAVGAAFDFLAGTVREAPVILRGSGFEWLYRLAREPRRLWRRYLIGNADFANVVFKELLGELRERADPAD